MQVNLTLFVFTGNARLLKGVNAKSVRLTCTSQPTDSITAKLEIPTERIFSNSRKFYKETPRIEALITLVTLELGMVLCYENPGYGVLLSPRV